MYGVFSEISNMLTQPFLNLARGMEGIPVLFAFLLGIVGALAPCQFTANLGAVTVYGNKSVQKQIAWAEVIFFIIGKMVVFSLFGLIVWILGNEVKSTFITYFPWFRKLVGPILILIGLFMLGVIKFKKMISFGSIPERFTKKGKIGAFLMGVSFTLGFCPTMFTLFFVTLMPLEITVPYGGLLPSVFAIGTSFPLILAVFLIWYFELSGKLMKKQGRRIGLIVQRIAGVIIIILGILDAITFW
ncbi:urease accessory protein UreH domain-containing protein [Robertmurraya andreesenii]|uniref:Cytochrome c biogenesis protein CcdA n=1 Tax=Anoxybacillus andreesenii TaxID=1325932 RepID=A0ABT9VAD3_9BACL|nr:sulfite exporter TauE/SafE family protein [Robertmurraya andreesenii]MDQ0157889.1 cytochrome c biogenesis protein CcdA [Robertmurraya andreesenii]